MNVFQASIVFFYVSEEFDGMTLPEISELPPVTQNTPAIVKIGQHYGIPFTQSLGKKKHKPGT